MYDKLVGKEVKIVYQDGRNISVSQGKILEYDCDLQIVLVHDEFKDRDIYISAKQIHKLEVIRGNE